MSIELGNKVRDLVTGFEGIAISRIEYLNGCVQIGVKGPAVDNETKDAHYLDIDQIERIDDGVAPAIKKKQTGGVMAEAPKKGIGLAKL